MMLVSYSVHVRARWGAHMRMCAAEKVSHVKQRLNGVDNGAEDRHRVSNLLSTTVCFSRLRSRVSTKWKSDCTRFLFCISNYYFLF